MTDTKVKERKVRFNSRLSGDLCIRESNEIDAAEVHLTIGNLNEIRYAKGKDDMSTPRFGAPLVSSPCTLRRTTLFTCSEDSTGDVNHFAFYVEEAGHANIDYLHINRQ
jgi:hypothetical protein